MIAINTYLAEVKTCKIRCPECRWRICDMVIPEQNMCHHSYKVIQGRNSDSNIAIKCQKCGLVIGISLLQI